ncbi:MAG: hypothetical protein V2I35_04885 [Desulfocapsaceae bacterium]|nr:hypothetical protein [Desulfocapsaceae bacterium]
MVQSPSFRSVIPAVLLSLSVLSCSTGGPRSSIPPLTFPVTSRTQIIFDEAAVPDQCRVFSHLLVSIPAAAHEQDIKNRVEQFGMSHGADYILVGMARESSDDIGDISFSPYGPQSPYLFKTGWQGWKFGFRDWNSRGPLVDYGYNRLAGDAPAFETEVTAQMVLLSCQLGPDRQ